VIVKNWLIITLIGTSPMPGRALRSKNKGGSLPGKRDPVFPGKNPGSAASVFTGTKQGYPEGGARYFYWFLPSLTGGTPDG